MGSKVLLLANWLFVHLIHNLLELGNSFTMSWWLHSNFFVLRRNSFNSWIRDGSWIISNWNWHKNCKRLLQALIVFELRRFWKWLVVFWLLMYWAASGKSHRLSFNTLLFNNFRFALRGVGLNWIRCDWIFNFFLRLRRGHLKFFAGYLNELSYT